MTKLLDEALEAVRRLPADSQDDIASAMLQLAGQESPETIGPDHLPQVLEGLRQARARQFASETEIEAFRAFNP